MITKRDFITHANRVIFANPELNAYFAIKKIGTSLPTTSPVKTQITLGSDYSFPDDTKDGFVEAMKLRLNIWHGSDADSILRGDEIAALVRSALHDTVTDNGVMISGLGRDPMTDPNTSIARHSVQFLLQD